MKSTLKILAAIAMAAIAIPALAEQDDSAVKQRLTWPSPPAQARIEYVKTASGPEDLGIRKGFFAKLKDFVFGPSHLPLVNPMAVAVTAQGTIYVADPGAGGVHRFDVKGGSHRLILAGGKAMPSPVGLAAGKNGDVYVADSSLAKIFIIRPKSKSAVAVPIKNLKQPTGVAVDDASGRLYVLDTGEHMVKVFGMDGMPLFSFGKRGDGDGQFNYPTAIWRDDNGRILVSDSLNFRVQIFDREGKSMGKFGKAGDATGDFSRPKGVASDRSGHIYVVDGLFHAVQIFDEGGKFLLSFGIQGGGNGEFWLPAGIYVTDENFIYVADSRNGRLQVFRYMGGRS